MFSEQDFASVTMQLKEKIVAGKITCHRCHYPLSGKDITQIDLFNARLVYKCPNESCDNHDHTGYRTFRGLDISIPSISAPAELADVVAPAPPRPEEVSWASDEESPLVDAQEAVDEPELPVVQPAMDDDHAIGPHYDRPVEHPAPAHRPIQSARPAPKPAPIHHSSSDDVNDPNSEA